MVPRQHRLILRREPTFFHQARRFSSSLFTLFFLPAPDWQAAVIVPKKTGLTAVQRHKLRRQVLGLLTKKPLTTPGKMAIVARFGKPDLKIAELKAELQLLERKLKAGLS